MRKRILRALALAVVPFLGMLLVRFIYATNRKHFHLPTQLPDKPFVIAFWHGDLLMQSYNYYQLRRQRHIKIMISDHFDGQIISRFARFFDLGTVSGSSNKNPVKALIQAMRTLKDGYDMAITPDGPRGPRHEVSDGVIVMAQKTGSKVYVFHCIPSKYWQFGSWDKFTIPKPFGKMDFYISEPIDLSGMELEEARGSIKSALLEHRVPELRS